MTPAELDTLCRELCVEIGSVVGEGYGFALLLFEFDPGSHFVYISNAKRADMIRAIEELVEQLRSTT